MKEKKIRNVLTIVDWVLLGLYVILFVASAFVSLYAFMVYSMVVVMTYGLVLFLYYMNKSSKMMKEVGINDECRLPTKGDIVDIKTKRMYIYYRLSGWCISFMMFHPVILLVIYLVFKNGY